MHPNQEAQGPLPAAALAISAPPAAVVRMTAEQMALIPDLDKRTAALSALADQELFRQIYAKDLALARLFVQSGEFADLKDKAEEAAVATAMSKIQIGRSQGFNEMDSMRNIYFVNGRPSIENDLVAAKLQQMGYDWDIEWVERTEDHKGTPWTRCVGCRLWLKKWNPQERQYKPMLDRQGKEISVAFTEADADHALVWEKGKQIPLSQKAMYQSWARDMYYWKTISRVKKYHAPHVLRGVLVREEAQLETMPVESLPPAQIPPDLARTFEVPIEGVDRLKQTILAHPGWGDPHAQITKEQISGEISVSPPAAAEPATAPATEPAQAPATEEAAQESFFPPPAPATEDQKPPRKRTKE